MQQDYPKLLNKHIRSPAYTNLSPNSLPKMQSRGQEGRGPTPRLLFLSKRPT